MWRGNSPGFYLLMLHLRSEKTDIFFIMTEKVTVLIVLRDRFSTLDRCLRDALAHSGEGHDFLAVFGGAPESVKKRLTQKFAGQVQFVFEDRFLTAAESRNIGLRKARTRLAAILESDVYARPGWLEALVRCQQETQAAMAAPIILEKPDKIHTAGNDFYITYEKGKPFGHKELRYYGMIYGDSSNLARRDTDYVEFHAHLVEVKTALELNLYDETLFDMHELDAGLKCKKAGRKMFFEPGAVVHFDLSGDITEPEDVRSFCERWDMAEALKAYRKFEEIWGIDITEHGNIRNWFLNFHDKLGLIPRALPNRFGFFLHGIYKKFENALDFPMALYHRLRRRLKARKIGFYTWPSSRAKWWDGL